MGYMQYMVFIYMELDGVCLVDEKMIKNSNK